MDTVAIDALGGAGCTILGFILGRLDAFLRDQTAVRRAARIISGELLENRATAGLVLEHGPGWMPVSPRTTRWESHGGDLADIAPDALAEVEMAYSMVRILMSVAAGEGGDGDWSEVVQTICTSIDAAIEALAPYRRRRRLFG